MPPRLLLLSISLAFTVALAACPTPQSPKGPPPEYEEPPAPSWLQEAGAGADAGTSDGGPVTTPPVLPVPVPPG